jgi:putative intracellular protease/amidase
MDIVIPLFDRFTALDAIGPYEVLSRLPGATVTFVAAEPGLQTSDNRFLRIAVETTLDEVDRADVLVVPGGPGTRALVNDEQLAAWTRRIHETTTWTTSVCTGALVLGAAGLLRGLRATTHWLAMDELARLGAEPTGQRVVEQGKIITAAGVSSGIDMALVLASKIAGDDVARAIQLSIEYDPQPPFDAGSPEKAGEALVDLVRSVFSARPEGAAAPPS